MPAFTMLLEQTGGDGAIGEWRDRLARLDQIRVSRDFRVPHQCSRVCVEPIAQNFSAVHGIDRRSACRQSRHR